MDAKLVIVGGKANKSHVSVTLPAIIGRSREADLTVAHPMVSRKHCQLQEVDGLVMIRDLGSLNGTFVDQKQISEAALHPDAEFTVGPLTFRIEYEYVGRGVAPPEVAAPAQAAELPDTEAIAGAADLPRDDEAAVPIPPEESAPVDEAFPADAQPAPEAAEPAIAPSDGALPDFASWGGEDVPSTGQDQAGTPAPPPPLPPAPPPVAEPPTLFAQDGQDDLAETLELGEPQPAGSREVEIAKASGPSETPDAPAAHAPAEGPPGGVEPQVPGETPDDLAASTQTGSSPSDELDEADEADTPGPDGSDDEELGDFLKSLE